MQTSNDLGTAFLDVLTFASDRIAEYQDRAAWDAYLASEQRTVAQLIDHIAWAWEAESAAFRAMANGATVTGLSQEWLDAQNAEQARVSFTRTPEAIIARFCIASELTLDFIQELTPEQLQRSGAHMPGEPTRTVAEWIEVCLIGHPREHLAQIDETLARFQTST